MAKYEYTQLYCSFEEGMNHTKDLNKLGLEGWELVAAVKIDEKNIVYLFKRLLEIKTLLT